MAYALSVLLPSVALQMTELLPKTLSMLLLLLRLLSPAGMALNPVALVLLGVFPAPQVFPTEVHPAVADIALAM